ncbi:MAG: hypothetical protein ACTSRZ_05270 [Promethearchaeota archaeon]
MRIKTSPIIVMNENQIDLRSVIMWIYGLTDLDADIFMYLFNCKEICCIKYIIKAFNKDRTVIQRSLNKLFKFQLIEKIKMSLKEHISICQNLNQNYEFPERGYLYVYKSLDINELKQKLNSDMNYISKKIQKVIVEL